MIAETKGVGLNWITYSDSACQNTPVLASGTSSISVIYFFAGDYGEVGIRGEFTYLSLCK